MNKEQEILNSLNALDKKAQSFYDEQGKELKEHGTLLSTTSEKLEKLEKDIEEREEKLQKRIDDIELKADTPAQESGDLTTAQRKEVDAFENFMRHPRSERAQQEYLEAVNEARKERGLKAVQTTVAADGGHAVPEVISRKIGEKVQDISEMRRLVRVETVGTSDYKELIDVNGEESGWVGETGGRSETGTPSLEQCQPTQGTLYAYPKATEESLDDMFFDVQGWLIRKASVAFAKAEGVAFITGNGTNKPTGFLAGTPVSTNDEESVGSPLTPRAYQTIQYVATGAAAGFNNNPTGSPLAFGGDVFIDIEQEMKPAYRKNAKYLANKGTIKVIRKFKDSDGNYIWQRSMILGQPNTINGYEVVEMEGMPSIGANNFPVAFGDFMEGYLAVDRVGLRMSVDDNITTPGYVKYYMRKRQGGIIYNDDAIKVIKCATS